MKADKTRDGEKLTMTVEGSIDTVTAPQLEGDLRSSVNGISELEFDLAGLEYISSAGLRVLVLAVKKLGRNSVKLVNVSDEIRGILEMTGFTSLL